MKRTAPRLALSLVLALALAPQSAGAQSAATAVLDRAIARMGGDAALRAIRTIRMDVITQWQRTVLTDHPFADAPSYERHTDLRDYPARAWRNTREFIPTGRTVDIVADTVGARTVQGANGMPSTTPLNIAYVDERRELFAFAPERLLLLARGAEDLRALPDTTIAGVAHARVSATVEGFHSTLFLRRTDGLPALTRFRANETNDFGLAPWGTMEVEFWYSAWSRIAPGVLLPRQRDVRRIGRPYKRMTVVAMTVNAPAPADSFAITDTTARSYLANARRPMWDVALDSTRITAGHFVSFPRQLGADGAVRIGERWVLLETGQAAGAAKLAVDWLGAQSAGAPSSGALPAAAIVLRHTTGNGGVAWLADQRIPLYVPPGAAPMVRHILGAERGSRATVVQQDRWVRIGTDSILLTAVHAPEMPGVMAIYSPAHEWVYSPIFISPTYQPEQDALVARLRRAGHAVAWAGSQRGMRTALPPPADAPDPEFARLEAMRARAPRDAVVLYELAVRHAAAGRQHDALQLLDAVSRAPGALDPSFHRRFFPYHGDAEWQRTIGRIRAANPPIVRSTPAFTISERDLHPEGIAFDSVSRSLFVGSFKGKIVRVDSAGRTTDFAFASRPESARVVVGVRVDAARRHLWAAVADPRAFGDTTIDGGGLEQFDIGSGRVIASHRGAKGAFNDVVIAPNGDAFATNTVDGSIWRVRGGAFSAFLPPGSVREANGIAVSPDGRWLFAAGWHDIIRIDVRTRAMRPLGAPDGVVTGSFDGLYWYDGGLVGIQNGIHPGRVVRLHLDSARERITRARVLEQYHPQFNGMTTAALDGHTLLYLLNTQSRSFNPDGTVKPGVELQDIIIARLPLQRQPDL